MLKRAYAVLEIKSVDAEQRIITGIASTPEPDRLGDVMLPKGAKFTLPMPFLWQHKQDQPIGEVFEAVAKTDGIHIKARVANVETEGPLKDRIDMAWQSIVEKLVRGLSIGWMPIKQVYDKVRGGFDYAEWSWYELSAVTIPMNASATIQSVKSFDTDAASGVPPSKPAGASASTRTVTVRTGRPMKKSFSAQIADWEKTRAAKVARQEAIQQKATDDGRGKDDAEREEFATLETEIKSIDEELVDLRKLDEREKAAAVQVRGTTSDEGSRSRVATQVSVLPKALPPGIALDRKSVV